MNLASHFPVDGLILLAPALVLHTKALGLTPLIKYLVKKIPSNKVEKETDPVRIFLTEQYWDWNYMRQLAELVKIQKRTKAILHKIDTDMLLFISHNDMTVSPETARIIEKQCKCKNFDLVELQNSSHVISDSCDKERVADDIINWLQKNSKSKKMKVIAEP